MSEIGDELKEYIDQRDAAVEQRLKFWVVSSLLAQVMALVPVIFLLGGIYADGRAAVKILEEQQEELRVRGVWMQDRERWEMRMQDWAERQGYKPSQYNRSRK